MAGDSHTDQNSLDKTIVDFVHEVEAKLLSLLRKVNNQHTLGSEDFKTFSGSWKQSLDHVTKVPVSKEVDKALKTLEPLAQAYIRDLNVAKMLIAEIFENSKVSLDMEERYEILKNNVTIQLRYLEAGWIETTDKLQKYFDEKTKYSFESKINKDCQDLEFALWLLDNNAAMLAQTRLFHMVQGYQSMCSLVRDMYDLMKQPGMTGHGRSYMQTIRNYIFG